MILTPWMSAAKQLLGGFNPSLSSQYLAIPPAQRIGFPGSLLASIIRTSRFPPIAMAVDEPPGPAPTTRTSVDVVGLLVGIVRLII